MSHKNMYITNKTVFVLKFLWTNAYRLSQKRCNWRDMWHSPFPGLLKCRDGEYLGWAEGTAVMYLVASMANYKHDVPYIPWCSPFFLKLYLTSTWDCGEERKEGQFWCQWVKAVARAAGKWVRDVWCVHSSCLWRHIANSKTTAHQWEHSMFCCFFFCWVLIPLLFLHLPKCTELHPLAKWLSFRCAACTWAPLGRPYLPTRCSVTALSHDLALPLHLSIDILTSLW